MLSGNENLHGQSQSMSPPVSVYKVRPGGLWNSSETEDCEEQSAVEREWRAEEARDEADGALHKVNKHENRPAQP
jgi:hypothetical protein